MKKPKKHIRYKKRNKGLGNTTNPQTGSQQTSEQAVVPAPAVTANALVQQPVTAGQPEDKLNLKEIVIYSTVGLVVIGGTIFLLSKAVRKTVANTQEKKALDVDSSASIAKTIRMALDNDMWFGWGTDEEALRKVIRDIPSKDEFKKVAASYKKLYGEPLTKDLQGDLSTAEYNEMMAIIAGKPEKKGEKVEYNHIAAAIRLYNAMSIWYGIFPGTDEDAIKSVFLEIPTQADYKKVESAYYKKYGNTLQYDLEGDLSSSYIDEFMSILHKKPKS